MLTCTDVHHQYDKSHWIHPLLEPSEEVLHSWWLLTAKMTFLKEIHLFLLLFLTEAPWNLIFLIRFAGIVFNNGSGLCVCLHTKTLILIHILHKWKTVLKECDTGNNQMKNPSEKCRPAKYKLPKCSTVHYKSEKSPAVLAMRLIFSFCFVETFWFYGGFGCLAEF